jgi:selenocysteine-specific elongation factor
MGLVRPGEPVVDDWYVDEPTWQALVQQLGPELAKWHHEHPLDAGMPEEAVRQHLALPDPALVAPLVRAAGLVSTAGRIHRPGTASALPARVEAAVQAVTADLRQAPFAAPDANRLNALGLGARELAAAVRAGRLLKVADGVVLLPDAVDTAASLLATLAAPFTLSQARQALDTSRRVAVPLLELLDREGVTERLADSSRRLAANDENR